MPRPTNPTPHGEDLARGLERLLLDLAIGLINVRSDQLDEALRDTLAAVGTHTGVDRVTVVRYDWDAGTASATQEWCAPGIEAVLDQFQLVSYETVWPEYAQRHRDGKQTFIPEVSSLPPGPFRDILIDGGTRSLIDTPLIDGGRCLGFVALETVGRPVRWSQPHHDVLRVLAQLLINVEHRRHHAHTARQLARVSEINLELERFAGVVAHDLQAPLASSQGLLALVRSGRVPAEQHDDLLERAELGLHRMSGLIDRLLQYASSGRVLGSLQPVLLDDVVDDALEACQRLIADRGAQVHYAALPTVDGDHHRLVEVVVNLVANAIRHTPEPQTPHVWIASSEDDHGIVLVVADDGPGIPAEDRTRVLTPFDYLAGASTNPGTGLGLPIVAAIVEAHGGELDLDTSEAGGLLVRIRLPRNRSSGASLHAEPRV